VLRPAGLKQLQPQRPGRRRPDIMRPPRCPGGQPDADWQGLRLGAGHSEPRRRRIAGAGDSDRDGPGRLSQSRSRTAPSPTRDYRTGRVTQDDGRRRRESRDWQQGLPQA
jgi:hypothetical protein